MTRDEIFKKFDRKRIKKKFACKIFWRIDEILNERPQFW